VIVLSGGTEAVGHALTDYQTAWKAFIIVHHLELFDTQITATTLSWKVADKTELFADLQSVAGITEQVHIGTVNSRYIASCVLTEPIQNQLWILKILERRYGSDDPLGLDSIDFLVADTEVTFKTLQAAQANVVKESNDMHDWLSLHFGKNNEFEAKFTNHLVTEVGIKELKLASDELRKLLS
jgi:hypothetical protein